MHPEFSARQAQLPPQEQQFAALHHAEAIMHQAGSVQPSQEVPSDIVTPEQERPLDPEVKRLIEFDRALADGDTETLNDILLRAEQASTQTDSSELNYLMQREDAFRSAGSFEAMDRLAALDRAASAKDEAAISKLFAAYAEDDDSREVNQLLDRLSYHRRADESGNHRITPSSEVLEEQRQEKFNRGIELGDKDAQSEALDEAFEHGHNVGDFTEYDSLLHRFAAQDPEYSARASEREKALKAVLEQGIDKHRARQADKIMAIIRDAEKEVKKHGHHESNRLWSLIPNEKVGEDPRPQYEAASVPEKQRTLRFRDRVMVAGAFLVQAVANNLAPTKKGR